MAVEQIGTGGTDGSRLGVSGGKVGFYGTTPIARPSVTWRNTTTATTSTNKVRIQRIYTALVNLGLIVTT
jgi:hypothetical protein